MILLHNNLSLTPIGVGEVLRRINGKGIVLVLKNNAINCIGSLKICAGSKARKEAAVHLLNSMYNNENNIASNACNSLNREVH